MKQLTYVPSGIFITEEELGALKTQKSLSGMWDSQGNALGNPEREVKRLAEKYNHPDWPINIKDGQFYKPEGK